MHRPINWEVPRIHPDWDIFQRAAQEEIPAEESMAAARGFLEAGTRNLIDTGEAPLQPVGERAVDFSVRVADADPFAAEQSCSLVRKVVEFPAQMVRNLAASCHCAAMHVIFRLSGWPANRANTLQKERAELAARDGWCLREVVMEGSRCKTTGLVISSPDTVLNRKWVLQATGAEQSIENFTRFFGHLWLERGYNTLLLQGPGAPLTEGMPSPLNLGEAQRLGIRFLETAIQAREIVLSGLSLGGGMIGEAILHHNFLQGENAPRYQVIRTITFSSLKDVASDIAGCPAAGLVKMLNCDMRNFEASRCLSELGIPETIIGCGDEYQWLSDDLIGAAASLGRKVSEANLTLKKFVRAPFKHTDERYVQLAADQLVPLGPPLPDIVSTWSLDGEPVGAGPAGAEPAGAD